MLRILFFLPLAFLLSSCLTTMIFYSSQAERFYISGTLDVGDENLYKYSLVYLLDGDTSDIFENIARDDLDRDGRKHLKTYYTYYCNILIPLGDVCACDEKLRGNVDVEIFLKNNESGKSYLLAKEMIDMSAYSNSVMRTEVFVGTDTALYVPRKVYKNINWERMQPFVLKDENRTIYHYTIKLRDTRDEFFTPSYSEKYLVEFP